MGPQDKICYCYNVPYSKLWNYAQRLDLQRPSQMSECFGAGTGCGWCLPILKQIFEASQDRKTDDVHIDMTAEEYAQRRQTYIRH